MDNLTAGFNLSAAVSALQLGLSHREQLGNVAPLLADTVRSAGSLEDWNLPERSLRVLEKVRDGGIVESGEALKSLALLAARAGASEVRSVEAAQRAEPAAKVAPLFAIRELFAPLSFAGDAPRAGFWSRMAEPSDGFSPFVTERGTKIAFFSNPLDLGAFWSPFHHRRWENGLGLVAYLNEASGSCGMIFVHGVGRAPWSKPARNLWLSSGGTMAFPQNRLSFDEALTRVVDKGVAMTLKWRSIDEALRAVGHDVPTGLGGSKGIILYGGGNGRGYSQALDVYAEVLEALGISLTGSDEGVGPDAADRLARLASWNIVGSKYANYRGHMPIGHTASGVFNAITALHGTFLGGAVSPVLIVGFGGIGSLLYQNLLPIRSLPVAGISDIDPEKLIRLRADGLSVPLYHDETVSEPGVWQSLRMFRHRIGSERGLDGILSKMAGVSLVSPNGGPQAVTFDAAAAMISGGVRAIAGAANNQNEFDAHGSPDAIAWILQAAGIFHSADFVVNRMGAAAVIANAIGLGHFDLKRMAEAAGQSVRVQMDSAYRRGIPPYVLEKKRAERAWNDRLASREARGGKFADASR